MTPARIVLIEDNPADVLLFELALKESGIVYELTRYANGEDAVRSLCDPDALATRCPTPSCSTEPRRAATVSRF